MQFQKYLVKSSSTFLALSLPLGHSVIGIFLVVYIVTNVCKEFFTFHCKNLDIYLGTHNVAKTHCV